MERFEVFYDGDCPLCHHEIEMLRRWDRNNQIVFTDIASPEFSAEQTGKSLTELMKSIHGRDMSGNWVSGVEVFRQLYSRVGFRTPITVSRWPIIRHGLDFGYKIFAWIRYKSAVRRMRSKNCNDGVCDATGSTK